MIWIGKSANWPTNWTECSSKRFWLPLRHCPQGREMWRQSRQGILFWPRRAIRLPLCTPPKLNKRKGSGHKPLPFLLQRSLCSVRWLPGGYPSRALNVRPAASKRPLGYLLQPLSRARISWSMRLSKVSTTFPLISSTISSLEYIICGVAGPYRSSTGNRLTPTRS